MVAELRKIGIQWVLYTNENHVYNNFSKYVRPIHKIPYFKNGKLIGCDYYFNNKAVDTVRKITKGQLHLGI
jgi:hypothetical protein